MSFLGLGAPGCVRVREPWWSSSGVRPNQCSHCGAAFKDDWQTAQFVEVNGDAVTVLFESGNRSPRRLD